MVYHPLTPGEVTRARQDTPGCSKVLHFNNAGAALMPRAVRDGIVRHLDLELVRGGYEAEEEASGAIQHTYDAVARLLNCRPDEVAIVENATRAWDMAFYAVPLCAGDVILTSMAEYASNYIAFLQVCRRIGATVEAVPSEPTTGELSISALRERVKSQPNVKLIAISHVPTNGGLVNPAAEVGAVAREAGILYLLDACQSAGQMPLDVQAIGCDMLSATGRKYLRGPRGTGFLFVRREVLRDNNRLGEPPFLDLHAASWVSKDRYEIRSDARRFENWETNHSTKIALGIAIDYALSWGLDRIWARIQSLASMLRSGLSEIAGVIVRDIGKVQCGIVTFTIAGVEAPVGQRRLADRGMNVTTTSAFGTRLDMESRGLKVMIRASVHYYNSEDEVSRFCEAVRDIAAPAARL